MKINLTSKLSIVMTLVFLLLVSFLQAQKPAPYESVPGDILNTRIYTLDNGLKVYLSIYKDAPRIQTAIAVRTGSKNDPHDNTGLSHYLEHLMFKGTKNFGTVGYDKEEPYLRQIDSLFDVYRTLKDTLKRKATYHIIDSISGIAAKYAIANEYDKMLGVMGAKNTNAFTSVEQTVYINDIPSNQLETWLMVEADRFADPVFRIFHTELETVYEEKNMSLDNDDEKVWETLYAALFPTHTYGTQTTIGTIEHLKNPSLNAIKAYFRSRYVPNNMAICLSGDFNPDMAIQMINKTWGAFPKKEVQPFVSAVEDPINGPVVKEVLGPEAESLNLGFRLGGNGSREADLLILTSKILYNGTAGLIDLDLVQGQKVLEAYCYADLMKDYSAFILAAKPKEGQSLTELKDLLLLEIDKVKKGEFPDWLLQAIINELKLEKTKRFETNMGRTMTMVSSFVLEEPWKESVNEIDRLKAYSKKDIVDFANKSFNNNYVVIYKKTGDDPNVKKVSKPVITPVEVNRDASSAFVQMISARQPANIEPVFIDYQKDILNLKLSNGIPCYYKANTENQTFDMYMILDMGNNNNPKMGIALDYLQYLGTSKFSPAEFQQELYKIGCKINVYASEDQVWISLSGLTENFIPGLDLLENLLNDPRPNEDALKNLVGDVLKKRTDAKLNKGTILWNAMYNYGQFGRKSPFTNILSETELKDLKSNDLLELTRGLESMPHRILYYGSQQGESLLAVLNREHRLDVKKALPVETPFIEQDVTENQVYLVDYEMKQVEIIMLSKSEKFNKLDVPAIRIFNEYFGGTMASIVFQELREARALAYSAYGGYRTPSRPDRHNYIFAYIGTQSDKLPEAMSNMMRLFNDMPESQKSFTEAKDGVLNKIRTERITKSRVLFNYENARKLGLTEDLRKSVFEKVPGMKFSDLKTFEETYMKNKKYSILVLGKKENLDIPTLEKYGKVNYLSLEDVFGY